MLLSFFMPQRGNDEEDHIATLETVRSIMCEGKKMVAADFYIEGCMSIELKLGTSRGSTVSTGMVCVDLNAEEGVVKMSQPTKKLRWPQLRKEFCELHRASLLCCVFSSCLP